MKASRFISTVAVMTAASAFGTTTDILVTEGTETIVGPNKTETMQLEVRPTGADAATLVLKDKAYVEFPDYHGTNRVGATSGTGLASLTVSNAVITAPFNPTISGVTYGAEWFADYYDRALRIGGTTGDGVVRLYKDSAITNRISLSAVNHLGAFYMYGGTVASLGTDANVTGASSHKYTSFGCGNGSSSDRGHGYFEMRDGSFKGFGSFAHGCNYAHSISYLTGGTFWTGNHPNGRGGWSAYYRFQETTGIAQMYIGGTTAWSSSCGSISFDGGLGLAVVTLDGQASVTFGSQTLTVGAKSGRTEPFILNLNGGTFSTYTEARSNADSPVYLNLNGGTLAGVSNDPLLDVFTRVTVFEKGATIDSSTCPNCYRLYATLDPPTGQGVCDVPLDAPITGRIAPPAVKIVGDGYGASAQALFDSIAGETTNILVTSHGCDYTTATAELYFNNTLYKSIPCTLAANAGGALKLAGSKYFVINGKINVPEIICNGSDRVYLGVANTISSNTIVTVKSGSCEFATTSHTFVDNTPLTIRGDAGASLSNRSYFPSVCPSIEGSGNMSWGWGTNLLVGCWNIDAATLVANKAKGVVPEYQGRYLKAMVFAPTATVNISNAELLEKSYCSTYPIFKCNFDSTVYGNATDFKGMPTLVGRAAANWRLVHKDKELRLVYHPGTAILFR